MHDMSQKPVEADVNRKFDMLTGFEQSVAFQLLSLVKLICRHDDELLSVVMVSPTQKKLYYRNDYSSYKNK